MTITSTLPAPAKQTRAKDAVDVALENIRALADRRLAEASARQEDGSRGIDNNDNPGVIGNVEATDLLLDLYQAGCGDGYIRQVTEHALRAIHNRSTSSAELLRLVSAVRP